ncbi:SAM hydrolase/SAM-dependent halogenase family protein [Amycolatopsis sp. H20-H5]|uniref:SAM hydrolase/SAM-dependent halogenase family protein n=1 Tax=Amycolatopsis sp. H20-H5 TaxID=3046309 RepID=UPI002DBF1864|nr:SAM-dependent chlorinase/fluorinase [Amycolatopsis sp. H20-H5]MEC3977059.1 SAM-dependent chlorinase/fluorinase [Amycolatopsis sp. H20-H5]
MEYHWISFTTDYGLRDGFVAACHGVIARVAPSVRVIDITHVVPPQLVRHGATVLADTVAYLPEAVHLAVVDPGVGTRRRGVVVVAANGLLVGPDNGLLLPAAEALGGVLAAYALVAPDYRTATTSATFHGRDVFAPAAAHLALGVAPEAFGPPVEDLVRLPDPLVAAFPGKLVSEVLTVDHFGNLALAATPEDLRLSGLGPRVCVYSERTVVTAALGRTFADVAPGAPVLYTDSAGRLAVAINRGSAAEALDVGPAQELTITASPTAT